MKKTFIAVIAIILVMVALSAEAGVSFIGSVKVGGGSVISEGKAAGCGTGSCEKVTMNVSGSNLSALCKNNGGKIVPGQHPVNVESNTTSTFTVDASGTFNFNIREEILPTNSLDYCPNGNWKVIDLSGPITVTLSLYETGVSTPSDVQVFNCNAVFGVATNCSSAQ